MDRLHSVIAALSLAMACDAGAAAPPPPGAGRVEAVTAKKPAADPLAGFCDNYTPKGAQKTLSLPPLTPPLKEKASAPQWVNLWATWCKPCVEEMPMIAAWQKRRAAAGAVADVLFVSVDAEASAVEEFRKAHPNIPESRRLDDPEALNGLIEAVGLDPGAGVPIHIFANAGQQVRCVRSGAVTEEHLDMIDGLMN
ncbi:MAG: TlpA family protein disulfide reductase [Myxococcales bacterium]|nr:TlpA family protein disulfide reductase [Myxococcales bacterium]